MARGRNRGAGMLTLFPGLGSTYLLAPPPQAWLCPCPVASGKERALSTAYFPVGLYFSFHHLLTLDVEIRAGVHRAEKVLSIFFPSCRLQKGIVGSIAFYIMAGFDPLSIGDINLLPLSFSVGVSILSRGLKFLRRKCKFGFIS